MSIEKIKIGITGQSGFIGSHLFSYLRIKEDLTVIPFDKCFFKDQLKLVSFVKNCDVIIHAAGLSRSSDINELYKTNIKLDTFLASAIKEADTPIKILFASTIHENRETLYHKSKRDGHIIFKELALETSNKHTTLIMPNLFGPYAKPFFNSFVSTFCYQIVNKIEPKITLDSDVELMFIGDICRDIYSLIKNEECQEKTFFTNYTRIKVSDVLGLLKIFYNDYIYQKISFLNSSFEQNLFLTFKSYF